MHRSCFHKLSACYTHCTNLANKTSTISNSKVIQTSWRHSVPICCIWLAVLKRMNQLWVLKRIFITDWIWIIFSYLKELKKTIRSKTPKEDTLIEIIAASNIIQLATDFLQHPPNFRSEVQLSWITEKSNINTRKIKAIASKACNRTITTTSFLNRLKDCCFQNWTGYIQRYEWILDLKNSYWLYSMILF